MCLCESRVLLVEWIDFGNMLRERGKKYQN